jgi:beta-lactamase regulating signal transducer with metallopeptidase domain
MHVLIGIALKSLLIAGVTLGLLELMKKRSAAERSWVAHIGLLALLIMAFAPLALPSWNVEAPALFGKQPSIEAPAVTSVAPTIATVTAPDATAADPIALSRPSLSATAITTAVYGVPAAILLFITFLALARLIALRARADVLVDGHWLSALARAQKRMGFKHGTALLTSNELASPISWGLMRPVILLNSRAVEASNEAEAIIAHELAHVARMDWAKLLLARIATALFWFNPLVWILAREAHQLREETADDTVLAADIVDTDYAQLLVGVARHQCPGLLLGAHGVAPSKNSLARRVARVLDGKSVRGPGARSFAAGVLVGAVLVAAPLAALTLTPAAPKSADAVSAKTAAHAPIQPYYSAASQPPSDLPHLIADGVSTAVTAVAVADPQTRREARAEAVADALADSRQARRAAVADAAEATGEARNEIRAEIASHGRIDQIIEMRAAGIDADYVNALRAAQPRLRSLDPAEFAGMKAVGVTPAYARELAAAGFNNLDSNGLAEARAIGLSGDYVRGMAAAGVPLRLDDYVQLRAVGVPIRYVADLRKTGHSIRDADSLVQMWAVGVRPADLKAMPPAPPRTPPPPDLPDSDSGGG